MPIPNVDSPTTGADAPSNAAGAAEYTYDQVPDGFDDDDDEIVSGDGPSSGAPADGRAAPATGTPGAAQPSPTDPAQPRDQSGRFAPKGTPGEPSAGQAPASQPGDQSNATGRTDQATLPENVEPVAYVANRQNFTIPGSYIAAGGERVIPEKAWSDVQQLLAAGRHHLTTWRQTQADWQAKLAAKAEAETRAETILSKLDELRKGGPAAISEWLADLDRNWALLEKDAQIAHFKAAHDSGQAVVDRQQAERDEQQLNTNLDRGLDAAIGQVVNERFAQHGLTAEDLKPIKELLWDARGSIFFRADADTQLPDGRVIPKGEIVVDYGPILKAIQNQARLVGQARKAAQTAVAAAQANGRRQGERSAPPPPAGGAAVGGANDNATGKSKADLAKLYPKTQQENERFQRYSTDMQNAIIAAHNEVGD